MRSAVSGQGLDRACAHKETLTEAREGALRGGSGPRQGSCAGTMSVRGAHGALRPGPPRPRPETRPGPPHALPGTAPRRFLGCTLSDTLP